MRYALLIHVDPTAFELLSEVEQQAFERTHRALQDDLRSAGELLSVHKLDDAETAVTVRSVRRSPTRRRGSFYAGPRYLGGCYFVDVVGLDRAVAVAERLPEAGIDGFAIEVRPIR